MNELIPITSIDDGTQAVLGRDVCAALEIKNSRDAINRLDQDGVGIADLTDSLGRNQNVKVINEPALYELIFQSRVKRAQDFKRWVTHEVLPSIRKTGGYINGSDITRMELIQIALNAETERLALEAQNKELEPKAEAYESFIDATGHYGVGAVAKMLGKSQNWLFRELRNRGVLIAKGAMRNTPYQKYMHHFVVKAHEFERSNGEPGCSYTTYVQPSGVDFIRRKLGLPSIDPLPFGV